MTSVTEVTPYEVKGDLVGNAINFKDRFTSLVVCTVFNAFGGNGAMCKF